MKKILILGGTGAMGSPLVEILKESGIYEVHVTTRQKHANYHNVPYITGNARDLLWVKKIICSRRWDVIIDFMSYKTEEFRERYPLFLEETGQYIFLSSARVFANSDKIISECSPKLLDVCKDEEYLSLDEYALAKARSENMLLQSTKKNWTIIRPYITYNDCRLQLVSLEKESWLKRGLEGNSIPFPKDTAYCKTTLTYAYDVANAIAMLIGNEKALGIDVNITGNEVVEWKDILEIYQRVIQRKLGKRLKVWEPEDSQVIEKVMNNKYQLCYDRMFDRVFDNSKLIKLCGELKFIPVREGLEACVEKFLDSPRWLPMSEARSLAIREKFQ